MAEQLPLSHPLQKYVLEKQRRLMQVDHPPIPAMKQALRVSEIVQMAQAGVKIDFKDIEGVVVPDKEYRPLFDHTGLLQPLLDRWNRANPPAYEGGLTMFPFRHWSAGMKGDKVYVFIVPMEGEPVIIEDEKMLYPSDALIAKMHLLLQTQGGVNVVRNNSP